MAALSPAQLARLQSALDAKATEKSRAFWSKYLKGNAVFRGVPMAGVREGDARIPGLTSLVLQNADALVRDPERFAQTGVGWVLRELSVADRKRIVAFAERHAGRMSREGMKYIVEKMPAGDKKRLLALQTESSGSARPRKRS